MEALDEKEVPPREQLLSLAAPSPSHYADQLGQWRLVRSGLMCGHTWRAHKAARRGDSTFAAGL